MEDVPLRCKFSHALNDYHATNLQFYVSYARVFTMLYGFDYIDTDSQCLVFCPLYIYSIVVHQIIQEYCIVYLFYNTNYTIIAHVRINS